MNQYSVYMRLEYNSTVTVEAESVEEAKAKAKAGDFVDDGLGGASLANWEVKGEPHDEVEV
jgi:hypothetical protein